MVEVFLNSVCESPRCLPSIFLVTFYGIYDRSKLAWVFWSGAVEQGGRGEALALPKMSNLAIIGQQVYSDTQTRRENCVNIWRYRQTLVEVCSTWYTKNDAHALSPVGAISVKMGIQKTSIFGEVYLFSDTVVCTFSEAAFGEILASIWCPKISQIRNIFS